MARRYRELQSQARPRCASTSWLAEGTARPTKGTEGAPRGPAGDQRLESHRPSCAAPRPSSSRCARPIYDAGDLVNQAQGRLYEAGDEVARREAEIRYVAEGSTRQQQRIDQPKAQADRAVAAARGRGPVADLERLAEPERVRCRAGEILAAQSRNRPLSCRAPRTALRRHAAGRSSSVARGHQVQQWWRSRCWRRAARLDEQGRQLRQRRDRLCRRERACSRADAEPARAAARTARSQARAAGAGPGLARRVAGAAARLEEQRAPPQACVNQRGQAGARPVGAAGSLRALQDKVQDRRQAPWLAGTAWTARRPGPGCRSSRAGKALAVEALRERMGALEVGGLGWRLSP